MLGLSRLAWLLPVLLVGLALSPGCGGDSAAGGYGGASAGKSGTGGAAGRGGTPGTAGASGKGGATGTGGASGTGGANGGASGTGGANGGASGTGGANGGASGTGGANGGATGTGGASGGATGTGGAAGTSGSGSGGSAGVGGQGVAGAGGGGKAGAGAGGSAGAGGTSACGPCNAPPTACYALTGSCVNGACTYAFIEGADCDDGNACTINDTCTAGTCTGTPMVCTTPRAPACLDATHLQTYDNPGVCNGGRCVYTQETITCGAGGCAGNACQTDPCANVTCSAPPSVCYDAAGTCSQGSCSYPANHATCDDGNACTDGDTCSGGVCSGVPKLCNTPGPDSCKDASTAAVYDHVGTCAAGACSYAVHYVSCPAGCAAGVCNPSGWTSMTSNSNQSLWSVWGTSASSVWAVGSGGTALYYNGIQWQARPTPTDVQGDTLVSVSGTSDSNVFAVGTPNNGVYTTSVIHFDGTSWSFLGRVPVGRQYAAACVSAYADNDAFVWGYVTGGSSGNEGASLYRVTNGTATLVGGATSLGFSNQTECGIHAFSPSNIVATGNLQAFRIDTVAKTAVAIGSGSVGQGGALWADTTNDLFITSGANAQRWTGGPTWTGLTTGLSGMLATISGTSTNRVFAAGAVFSTPSPGTVLYLGWCGVDRPSDPCRDATPLRCLGGTAARRASLRGRGQRHDHHRTVAPASQKGTIVRRLRCVSSRSARAPR